MIKIIILCTFCNIVCLEAQILQPIISTSFQNNNSQSKFNSYKFKAPTFIANFKKNNVLNFYNKNTTFTDIYQVNNNSFTFLKSTSNIADNQFIITDSTNPYGTNNLGLGIIMGAIGSVLNFGFKIR